MIFAFGYYIFSFIISLISPFWGLVGFTCSLLLRFQDHYPQITSIKPFTLLLFGMFLSCIINKHKLATIEVKQDKLLLALLIISILGLLLLARGSLISETYVFICSLSLYYFASRILQTPNQVLILFISMAFSIAYLGYLAIEDVTLNESASPYIDPRSDRWQGIGYYENSNEFGQLMITTMPFLFAVFFLRKNLILKIISVALMSIMIYVMIKCASRTVMSTMALMLVGTVMLRGKGNMVKKGLVGGIMMVSMLGVLSFMPGPIQERMSTVLDAGNDESFQGRTRSWEYGFAMLSWYPITGVGKGQWMEYHGLMPHNSYVQVMAELGFFGIVIFLWIIGLCFKSFAPILSEHPIGAPPDNDTSEEEIEVSTDTNGYYSYLDDIDTSFEEANTTEPEPVIIPVDNLTKTISIAILMVYCGWLLYIFLGNQAYSVWTYFYLGLCVSIYNFPFIKSLQSKDSSNLKDIF